MTRIWRRNGLAMAAIAVLFAGCTTGPAEGPDANSGFVDQEQPLPTQPMSVETMQFLNDLSMYEADPNFSSVEWVGATGTIRVWWFGTPPAELKSRLSAAPVATEIAVAMNQPGPLRELAARLVRDGAPGVSVSGVGVAKDAASLDIVAEPDDPTWTEEATQAALESHAGIPITLTLGRVTPL